MRRSSAACTSSAPRRVRVSSSTRSTSAASRSPDRSRRPIVVTTEWIATAAPSASSGQIGHQPPPLSAPTATSTAPTTPDTPLWTASPRHCRGAASACRTATCMASGIASPSHGHAGQK